MAIYLLAAICCRTYWNGVPMRSTHQWLREEKLKRTMPRWWQRRGGYRAVQADYRLPAVTMLHLAEAASGTLQKCWSICRRRATKRILSFGRHAGGYGGTPTGWSLYTMAEISWPEMLLRRPAMLSIAMRSLKRHLHTENTEERGILFLHAEKLPLFHERERGNHRNKHATAVQREILCSFYYLIIGYCCNTDCGGAHWYYFSSLLVSEGLFSQCLREDESSEENIFSEKLNLMKRSFY